MQPEPRLMSIKEASQVTSLSRSSINQKRAIGQFPQAVPLGVKRIAFVRAEVSAWIDERVAARDR